MATDRTALPSVPAAAALLLWPALWNGYPIVFTDTGTYLSQAINHYAGWDRPVFYSLFMLPLHWTVTTWPVVLVQALLTAWILRLACVVLAPWLPRWAFITGLASLSACTWLPWMVCELMPDIFTPLLVLVLCILAVVPEQVSDRERWILVALATFMIASQQSSLPLACALIGLLAFPNAFRLIMSRPGNQIREGGLFQYGSVIRRGEARPLSSWPAKAGHPSLSRTTLGKGVDADLRRHDDRVTPPLHWLSEPYWRLARSIATLGNGPGKAVDGWTNPP